MIECSFWGDLSFNISANYSLYTHISLISSGCLQRATESPRTSLPVRILYMKTTKKRRAGFLVVRRHQTTSLCTAGTEIHSRVWHTHALNDQSSRSDVCSCDLKPIFKLLHSDRNAAEVVVPNKIDETALCLLVPEHPIQTAVIVTALYVHSGLFRDYFRMRWLKCHTGSSIYGTNRFKEMFQKHTVWLKLHV